jgi:hypothetical protein
MMDEFSNVHHELLLTGHYMRIKHKGLCLPCIHLSLLMEVSKISGGISSSPMTAPGSVLMRGQARMRGRECAGDSGGIASISAVLCGRGNVSNLPEDHVAAREPSELA